MARTIRNRPHWETFADEFVLAWVDRDVGSCFCCSQKRQRLAIPNRDRRMKPSDARRAALDRYGGDTDFSYFHGLRILYDKAL